MRKLLLLLLLSLLYYSSNAQSTTGATIHGTIADSATGKTIAQATVTLMQQSRQVGVTTTGNQGNFSFTGLAAGTYRLQVSMVGFGVQEQTVTLLENQVLQLEPIQLQPADKQLANVTVTAQKALVEDKGDRLVYNAEKDISNAGGTAADVLRKVPSLTVDLNGNVQMRGNGNIKVLVNGKPSAMMARNLADALRQMPASLIKTVEVITSPGAKYDAEGAAGVINIITKKGVKGFNGSVNAAMGDMNRSVGTNLSMRRKKIGLNFSATGYQYRNINEQNNVRKTLVNGTVANILRQRSEGDNTGTGGYGELSFDYDPDSATHLNFSANVWGGDFPMNTTASILLTDPAGGVLQSFRNDSRFKNPYGNGQLDLGYTRTFKKPEQEFSFLSQFSRMPDNYFYNTDRYIGNDIVYMEKSTNYSRNKEYTLQTDYTHPFTVKGRKDTTNIKLEVGAKTIIRDIGSEFRVMISPDGTGEMKPEPAQSNDFDYTQNVYSGYTSLRLSNQHKWTLNTGARLEHTRIAGNFRTTNTRIVQQYSNLIPSFNLSKGIAKHLLKLSYTQRITRPLIWYLNPWLNSSDPKNIVTGTPNLRPELNHAMELGHSFSGSKGLNINSALYYRLTDNAIEYLATVDPGGVSLTRPLNIAQRQVNGLNTNVSTQAIKGLNLSGGFDISYVRLSSKAMNQENEGFVWNANINATYNLPKDYILQANGHFNSGWISLQRTNSEFYWYGFSGKKQFWDKKASLTLAVNNPFQRGITQHNLQQAATFESEQRFFFVNRSFRLSFEWRFGQMSAEGGKQGKKIRNDDSGR